MKKRILIVGGVAGGASCAARARRLDEEAEIVIFDRGSYVSFANCGLPYHVGDVIRDEASLLLADAELFQKRFNIQVRLQNEVVAIARETREIEVRGLLSGKISRERYDALVLSPGAAPVRPPLPGIELPGIFVLRTIPDSRKIRDWLERKQARTAVVVGGGFIGLEMAENLAKRGLWVTVVEMLSQVLPPLDPEIAELIQQRLTANGVKLALGDGVAGFEPGDGRVIVRTNSGARHEGDLVILAIGVRPETGLAKAAGLEIGERGGIRVDEQLRTSDRNIWAVGDAVEVRDTITGQWALVPLAGPANRQGRIAADVICGRNSSFRGVQGTAICGVFGWAVAATGASEKSLQRAGITDYLKTYVHPRQHAGYYPGAKPIHLKLLFRKSDGRILGTQAVGEEGVDKRIDVIAMAIQKEGTVFDLEEAELCYAPQFGSAKDPVNLAGMAAANILRGDAPIADWQTLGRNGFLLLDVRDVDEFDQGHIPGAKNIPLPALRGRLTELSLDQEIRLYCGVGQRAYYASRVLQQRGFRVRNLPGGYQTYLSCRNAGLLQPIEPLNDKRAG
ncbi:MAG TPA: FAD-dependent oxidoreductase [Candidatus Binatia bacterium]|jgi:NADPH-dependent 2,4-dienoyl-CoA reductase/sulfur reductase-like enzyme/rhodanese-related sulfurtransferase|nr:FAD-dependent oxidoreductase [Candidatus Binatia bacterium]